MRNLIALVLSSVLLSLSLSACGGGNGDPVATTAAPLSSPNNGYLTLTYLDERIREPGSEPTSVGVGLNAVGNDYQSSESITLPANLPLAVGLHLMLNTQRPVVDPNEYFSYFQTDGGHSTGLHSLNPTIGYRNGILVYDTTLVDLAYFLHSGTSGLLRIPFGTPGWVGASGFVLVRINRQ